MGIANAARNAAKQLRTRASQFIALAAALDKLDSFATANGAGRKRLSRAARLKISLAQKKRWAKVKRGSR
jgi:hypothetical protein